MIVTDEKLAIWVDRFSLDPDQPSGLVWRNLLPYQNKQKMAGHMVDGYYRVKTEGKTYSCSHIVLALSGILPSVGETEADHIDRNPLNNSLGNLRWCTRSTNEQNKRKRGKSGWKYVRCTKEGRFRVDYQVLGEKKTQYVGTYDSLYEAHLAALAHRLEYMWNP